jgi:hypothetical protein
MTIYQNNSAADKINEPLLALQHDFILLNVCAMLSRRSKGRQPAVKAARPLVLQAEAAQPQPAKPTRTHGLLRPKGVVRSGESLAPAFRPVGKMLAYAS